MTSFGPMAEPREDAPRVPQSPPADSGPAPRIPDRKPGRATQGVTGQGREQGATRGGGPHDKGEPGDRRAARLRRAGPSLDSKSTPQRRLRASHPTPKPPPPPPKPPPPPRASATDTDHPDPPPQTPSAPPSPAHRSHGPSLPNLGNPPRHLLVIRMDSDGVTEMTRWASCTMSTSNITLDGAVDPGQRWPPPAGRRGSSTPAGSARSGMRASAGAQITADVQASDAPLRSTMLTSSHDVRCVFTRLARPTRSGEPSTGSPKIRRVSAARENCPGTPPSRSPSAGAEVRDLRERHEQIHTWGSANLLQTLFRRPLVDQVNLWVCPVVIGQGESLPLKKHSPHPVRAGSSRRSRIPEGRCCCATGASRAPQDREPRPPTPRTQRAARRTARSLAERASAGGVGDPDSARRVPRRTPRAVRRPHDPAHRRVVPRCSRTRCRHLVLWTRPDPVRNVQRRRGYHGSSLPIGSLSTVSYQTVGEGQSRHRRR